MNYIMNKSILFLVLFFVSCNSRTYHCSNMITLPVGESIGIENTESQFVRLDDYVVIPLESSDSTVIYNMNIYGMMNDKILLSSNNGVYSFKMDGKLEHTFCCHGTGPQEYVYINDLTFNSSNGHIYIHDFSQKKINVYDSNGIYIKTIKNDSIAAFKMNGEGHFITTFSPSEHWKYNIGVYDSLFSPIGMYIENVPVNAEADLFTINSVYDFDGTNYVLLSDTLYAISESGALPYLEIDNGKLQLPDIIGDRAAKRNERDNYVWGEYLYLVGKYCFLSYNFKGHTYYDVWNIVDESLLLRNKVAYDDEGFGVPIMFGSDLIYLWPKAVIDETVYFVIYDEHMSQFISGRSVEENPIIILVNKEDVKL